MAYGRFVERKGIVMKKNRKKWMILFLSCAIILTLIPLAYYGGVSKAAETPEEVTRGVVDSLEQLPQYNNEENLAAERGSKNHPFTILEIVPYEEYAEFGYHIGGCEPIDVENLYGRSIGGTLNSLNDFDYSMVGNCYFFLDEPEGNKEMYNSNPTPTYGDWIGNLKGYYERVEDGSGTFVCETETYRRRQKPRPFQKQKSRSESKMVEILSGIHCAQMKRNITMGLCLMRQDRQQRTSETVIILTGKHRKTIRSFR